MSSTIGSVAQLVKVIQRQLTARAPDGAQVGNSGRRPAAGTAAARYAQENLAALIGTRVQQIGRDDPQRGRKAFRVFLEAVLLAQLGEGLVNDPRFFQMVNDIQLAMEADPGCGALVARAIEQLLAEP
ncbi:hypothetical protein GTP58_09530 [Duganella sp. CY15W]|uniref:hypothetical protein n=1 Tax=Duganella sp. CY15W TaxID=2692172 RepID=UPI00137062E1|nr:hypothetical protein [Duganella sp. CY15W]MYM28563.1 hypothetical protein [Duganella sp. CY15W]